MKKAFTLIEILIVVLILGILINIAVPAIRGATIKARLGQMFLDVSQLERTLGYLHYAEGTLEEGSWINTASFGEYYHVDVPEENDYFRYYIYVYDVSHVIHVYTKTNFPPGYTFAWLCTKYIYIKDYAGRKKGDTEWEINSSNPCSKYLKALLLDAVVF